MGTVPVSSAGGTLWQNRDFRRLWLGAGATMLAVRTSAIAYPLLVLWHTGSVSQAGLVSFAALVPNLLVQLPAGTLADRWDRRRLMILSDLGCCLAAGGVAAAVLAGWIWPPFLMLAAFTAGSLAILYNLAERGAVRNLVAADDLPAALSQNEARGRVAGLLGQPAGSGLFTIDSWLPFLLAPLAHLTSLAMLLRIRKPFQAEPPRPRRSLLAEVSQGLAWTWRRRFLRTVLLFIAATEVLFQALLLAVMAIVQQSGRPPAVVGLVAAAGGIGGAVGAVTGTWWRRRLDFRAIIIGAMVAWAVLMPSVALTRNPVLLGLLYVGMAYGGGVVNTGGAMYQVQTTPDHLQGRVGSVILLIGSGSGAIGALAGGVILSTFGVTRTVLGIGAVMAALTLAALASPAVRRADPVAMAPLSRRPSPEQAVDAAL
jgi:MFS family permease